MKLCVVGNGPSAEGKAKEIDACDFVVRIKTWWQCAAENCGEKWDAHVHYGWGTWDLRPRFRGVHWFSQTISQVRQHPQGWERLSFLANRAPLERIVLLPDTIWDAAFRYLGRHPSTGFVAVCMAIEICKPNQLVLYGYDSTTIERPNYWDAQGEPVDYLGKPLRERKGWSPPHDQLAEKRAIAEIAEGRWLDGETETKLIWPDKPDFT